MSSTLLPSASELLHELRSSGLSLAVDGADLRVWPASSLSWADRAAIRARKDELLMLLDAVNPAESTNPHSLSSASPASQPALRQNLEPTRAENLPLDQLSGQVV